MILFSFAPNTKARSRDPYLQGFSSKTLGQRLSDEAGAGV
jgi:hypothetical protein